MATVYAGRLNGPAGFSRTVAIKRLHPQFAKQPELCAMFMDEARIASRLVHPNVVHTLDVISEAGELFLVMEYVQGQSLASLVSAARRRSELVALPIAIAITIGVLQGLHAAHEARNDAGKALEIVHRDVSPQNILVGVDGVARLLDFGVAKAIDRLQITRDGSIKGKLAYMSPEQIDARHVDRRADVYAAGVVLWELLTGSRLHVADSAGAVVRAVLRGDVPPPSGLREAVPEALDVIVLRALRVERDERFETALDFAGALERVVAPATPREVAAWLEPLARAELNLAAERVGAMEAPSVVTAAVPAPPIAGEPTPTSPVQAMAAPPATGLGEPRGANRRRTLAAAGGLGVVAVGAVLALWMRSAPDEASAAPPPPTANGDRSEGTTAAGASEAAPVPAPAAAETTGATGAAAATTSATGVVSAARPSPRLAPPPGTCNPPYYLDAERLKRYKPGCLR